MTGVSSFEVNNAFRAAGSGQSGGASGSGSRTSATETSSGSGAGASLQGPESDTFTSTTNFANLTPPLNEINAPSDLNGPEPITDENGVTTTTLEDGTVITSWTDKTTGNHHTVEKRPNGARAEFIKVGQNDPSGKVGDTWANYYDENGVLREQNHYEASTGNLKVTVNRSDGSSIMAVTAKDGKTTIHRTATDGKVTTEVTDRIDPLLAAQMWQEGRGAAGF